MKTLSRKREGAGPTGRATSGGARAVDAPLRIPRRVFLALAAAPSAWSADLFLDEWLSVANRLITTPPESYPWNWGEGVQWIGLMKAYEQSGDPRYPDYLERWFSAYLAEDLPRLLREGLKQPPTKPGYCGHWSPATAAALLFEARRKPAYLRMAVQVTDYIEHHAERSPERALGHWTGNHQLWVDTLYMACPLLAAIARIQRRPKLIDDAAHQILVYAAHLQDPATGLFAHMWDWKMNVRTRDPWGRGNGWVLMSAADTLEVMQKSDTHWASVASLVQRMAKGLLEYQTSSGLWHTVLDDPASYPEISATCMMVYGFLKLARLGILDEPCREAALRAWTTVNRQNVREGQVLGVSAGTDPGTRDDYKKIPLGTQTWGTGAYLLAGSEVHRLGTAKTAPRTRY